MNCNSRGGWKIFQQVNEYVSVQSFEVNPACVRAFVFAPFLAALASAALEVLKGKGHEFSASERGYKPRANENAKPNRD